MVGFFFTIHSGAPCQRMVTIPEVYWVQNVSVWLRKAFFSINWFSSVIQQVQLTRCSDTSAIPAHCLCSCTLARPLLLPILGQDTGLLLPLVSPSTAAFLTYLLLSFSCLSCAESWCFPETPPLARGTWALPEGQNHKSVTGLVTYV